MRAGEDPWDEPSNASCDTEEDDSPDPPEEDVDKGGTVLPASADTKVESELLHMKQWEQSYLRPVRGAALSQCEVLHMTHQS